MAIKFKFKFQVKYEAKMVPKSIFIGLQLVISIDDCDFPRKNKVLVGHFLDIWDISLRFNQILFFSRSNVQSKLQRFSPEKPAFEPPSSQHISTPTPSQSSTQNDILQSPNTPISTSLTKVKSRQKVEHTTPTQNIVDDEDDSKSSIVSEKSPDKISKESLSASYGRHLVESVDIEDSRSIKLTLRDLANEKGE